MSNNGFNCSLTHIKEPSGSSTRSCPTWLLLRLKAEKDARYTPHPFSCLSELSQKLNIMLPQSKHCFWRLTEFQLGQVAGLPNSFGWSLATNGMMMLIVNEQGKVEFYHKQHFELVPVEHYGVSFDNDNVKVTRTSAKALRTAKLFEKFDQL